MVKAVFVANKKDKKVINAIIEYCYLELNDLKNCFFIRENQNLTIFNFEKESFNNGETYVIVNIVFSNDYGVSINEIVSFAEKENNTKHIYLGFSDYCSCNVHDYGFSICDYTYEKHSLAIPELNYHSRLYGRTSFETSYFKEKYIKENTPPLDSVENVKWSIMDKNSITEFCRENYSENKIWNTWYSDNGYNAIFGLTYLSPSIRQEYGSGKDEMYIVGYYPYNGKNIIVSVAKITWNNNLTVQFKNAAVISYVETNVFYRKMGLFKELCKKIVENTMAYEVLVCTYESPMGKIVHTTEHIKNILPAGRIVIHQGDCDNKMYQKYKK